MGKVNKWVKRKWVRALRSGEYKQGTRRLVGNTYLGFEHCCLGVLACEMVPEFVRKNNNEIHVGGNNGYLPDDLAIMFGLDQNTQDKLSDINDQGDDFSVIADWIDANL